MLPPDLDHTEELAILLEVLRNLDGSDCDDCRAAVLETIAETLKRPDSRFSLCPGYTDDAVKAVSTSRELDLHLMPKR